jgi:hypothetical protein
VLSPNAPDPRSRLHRCTGKAQQFYVILIRHRIRDYQSAISSNLRLAWCRHESVTSTDGGVCDTGAPL